MYQRLQTLPRWVKTALFAVVDTVLIAVCLFAAFWMRLGSFDPAYFLERSGPLFALAPVLGLGLILGTGMHRIKLSAFEGRSIPRIAWVTAGLMLMAYTVSYVFALLTPRSVGTVPSCRAFRLTPWLRILAARVAARLL